MTLESFFSAIAALPGLMFVVCSILVTGLGLNISNIISLIGSQGFPALILFVVGSLLIGLVMGGATRQPAVCCGWVRHSVT
jgi:hypothetical protein